jgi:hypothetical protein
MRRKFCPNFADLRLGSCVVGGVVGPPGRPRVRPAAGCSKDARDGWLPFGGRGQWAAALTRAAFPAGEYRIVSHAVRPGTPVDGLVDQPARRCAPAGARMKVRLVMQ